MLDNTLGLLTIIAIKPIIKLKITDGKEVILQEQIDKWVELDSVIEHLPSTP